MRMVRCKFKCTSKREYEGWRRNNEGVAAPLYEYEFTPVSGGSPENDAFFAATPTGLLKVSTVTDGSFQVGQAYYLDLTAAKA